jgi:glycerol-3-phosphate O-acyltransferase
VRISDFIPQLPTFESNLTGNYDFGPENVYQEGSSPNKELIGQFVEATMLPGSRIGNIEALVELRSRSLAGESCLILAEHYSNFDFPALYRLTEKSSELGPDVAESYLPIRGMKLSESSPVTAVFTRSYDTIIIYPSRSLDNVSDPKELDAIRKISVPVNHAAMREMIERKHNGRIIIVFPAGTRYRPWDPSSRKGVREIHSYVKTFDNVLFLAINGNSLPPDESNDMTKDELIDDLMILTCSDIVNGRRFRKEFEAMAPEGKDPKQHVVDQVMAELEKINSRVEPDRLKEKKALGF